MELLIRFLQTRHQNTAVSNDVRNRFCRSYTHLKALGQGKVLKKTALKNIKRGKSYRQKCTDFFSILGQFWAYFRH